MKPQIARRTAESAAAVVFRGLFTVGKRNSLFAGMGKRQEHFTMRNIRNSIQPHPN
jgi:hypothetical protein